MPPRQTWTQRLDRYTLGPDDEVTVEILVAQTSTRAA
jgi:hypothetical protein